MPVGKGSLNRAAKANGAKATSAKVSETKATAKPVVAAASVITSSDDIHEKKFEAISKIKCDLPTYLL